MHGTGRRHPLRPRRAPALRRHGVGRNASALALASRRMGPSTRSVHAGRPPAERGAPLSPPVVLAAPYHLAGEAAPEGYGRYVNPTWSALEDALGALEDARALTFASGMAAIAALIDACTATGDTVVVPDDGYYGVKAL